MLQYILRRLLLMVPTLIGITFVTFMLIRLAPGDPVAFRLGGAGGPGLATAEGGTAGVNVDRERQILRTKVRLGLMREDGTIRLWDPATGDERAVLHGHPRAVGALAFSPDGQQLASGSADGSVRLWHVEDGRSPVILPGHAAGINALVFTPDGRTLASGSDDRTIRLWRLGTPDPPRVLEGHGSLVTALATSPDGGLVASGSRDKTIKLWDVASGRPRGTLKGHFLDVTALVFSPDGTKLYSGSRDRQVLVWDVRKATRLKELVSASGAVNGLALSPDGRRLAGALSNNSVALWDAETGEALQRFDEHTAAVTAVVLSSDGHYLASASRDKSVRVRPIVSAGETRVLSGHTSEVTSLGWGDGVIASGAHDVTKVPLVAAYLDWLWRLPRLELGRSFKDGRPVKDKILEALPVTLTLNVIAIVLTYLFSIPIGAYAAVKRNGAFDQLSSVVLFVLYSMPSFWVATMLIIMLGSPRGFAAQYLGFTLPFVNLHSDNALLMPYTSYLADYFLHLILPVVALTYASLAFLSRLVRTSMLEVLELDFVRTARAKGLSEKLVIGKHALRNSLISVTTVLGNVLPALIGGSVIIEYIFSIPGMGALGFDAILQRDYPVIMGITTLVAVLTMLGILLSDILYCIVDPRIKLK